MREVQIIDEIDDQSAREMSAENLSSSLYEAVYLADSLKDLCLEII